MDDSDFAAALAPRVRIMQIIAFALICGVMGFFGIATWMQATNPPPPPPQPILTYVGFAAAAIMLVAHLIVPEIVASVGLKRIGQEKRAVASPSPYPPLPGVTGPLVALYQTRLIVRFAMLEGAAFFCLIAYQIEGQWPILALVGVLVLAMLVRFPIISGVQAWIEQQQERLAAGEAV